MCEWVLRTRVRRAGSLLESRDRLRSVRAPSPPQQPETRRLLGTPVPPGVRKITQQGGDVGAVEVGGDNVGMAVAIHIGGAEALVGTAAYGVLRAGRSEVALAVSEHNGDFVVGPALDGDIDVAVAVEVGGDDAVGVRPRRDREWRAGGRMEAA